MASTIIERFHEPFLWWGTPTAFLGALCVVVYVFLRFVRR